jgi:PAS domain S-box-containing protein
MIGRRICLLQLILRVLPFFQQILMTSDHDRAKLHELLIQELEDFAVFLVDIDGRIRTWNPGVERFFRYTEAEFIGRNLADIFTPEDRAAGAPENEMEKARRLGRSSDVRWHLCNDQTRVFVEGVLIGIKDQAGALVSFAKIARAVRPKHAAGSMLATLLEGTDDAIYALDEEGRFVFANTQTARLLGRSIDTLVGLSREEVQPSSRAADMRATDENVMRGHQPQVFEEQLPSSRGERVLLTTKAPWRDSDGRTIGLVAIAQDITAQKASQAERERLFREVCRKNEELSAFSHVVAHDLRTPLRSVKIYTELLARHLEGRSDETARQFMAFVADGAKHMDQLIEALLHYAESGEELAHERVNVNALIDGLLHTLAPLIQETEAKITSAALPDNIQADPVRLLQLLQNLVVNAIKYRASEPPRINISAESAGSEYRFAVSDNGIGIAPEHCERIFIPLQRLHGKEVPGTGLGLALCRKIVESHGGRIWVESRVGRGSTFFFTLPKW